MSLELRCPNCTSLIGDIVDNKTRYYKYDKNGYPECPTCGAGESMEIFERKLSKTLLVVGFILIAWCTYMSITN